MVRLDVSIGPVQGFVGQSRRTRDLWGSSYLLSVLSAYGLRGAAQAAGSGGKIIMPVVEGDPLYRWVSGVRDVDAPRIGSVPNHFAIETKEPVAVAHAAERAFRDAWRQVCDAVWECVVKGSHDSGYETEAIWKRQTENFWEIMWTAGTGPADAGSFLACRKQWRSHRPSGEPGDKCTVMHDRQELSGHVRAVGRDARMQQEEFWGRIRAHDIVGPLNLREDERLCSIALVKRLFPLVPGALDWSIPNASKYWPSTVFLGAFPWIRRVRSAAPREVKRYAEAVVATCSQALVGGASGTGDSFRWLDPNCYHLDFVRDKQRCPLIPGSMAGVRDDLVRHLMAVYRAPDDMGRPLGRPSSFFALVKADGDRLGRLVSILGPEHVGKALARFTREVPAIVERHGGRTVYAGGDDVLAMVPVPGALACAEELGRCYRSAFRQGNRATLSASVLFAHVRSPLGSVLAEVRRLLDTVAKDGNGRDSLAVGVLKPGGLHCEWATTWTRRDGVSAVQSVGYLVQMLRRVDDPGLSSSLVYRIREMLSFLCDQTRWEPGAWGDLPQDLEIGAFLHAEILRSLGNRAGERAQGQAMKWTRLVQQILPRARADEGATPAAVGVDGLMLARFLADSVDGGR